jgi:hypothetical protein
MAAHRHDLRDEGDAESRIAFRRGDRGTQAGTAAADHHHIDLHYLHQYTPLRTAAARPAASSYTAIEISW